MTLAELINEAKQGSSAAQQFLFERLSPRAKMLCTRYVKNNEDAQEIMQDGFYKFFKNLVDFRYGSEAGVYAYIKKIMVNECLMFLRKTNSFSIVSETELAETPVQDTIFQKLESVEIYKMVLQLPVGYRTVFNLYAIEGYEHNEIAAALGITEVTSRTQLFKARGLLQKMLTSLNETNYEKEESQ